jgi:NADH:ubiquinone oxidoreductase subunit 5 (subunit L)/multisubunit Na+/H+ antiporter MnhA subunit
MLQVYKLFWAVKRLSYTGGIFLIGFGFICLFLGLASLITGSGVVDNYRFIRVSRFKRGGFCQLDGVSCIFIGVVAYIRGFVSIYSE